LRTGSAELTARLPSVGQELADPVDRVSGEAREDVVEVFKRVQAVSPGRLDQGEERRGGAASALASGEQPVLALMPSFA